MNRLPLDPRQSALAVRCGIRFFLSAALTGCELLSGAPLALGFRPCSFLPSARPGHIQMALGLLYRKAASGKRAIFFFPAPCFRPLAAPVLEKSGAPPFPDSVFASGFVE